MFKKGPENRSKRVLLIDRGRGLLLFFFFFINQKNARRQCIRTPFRLRLLTACCESLSSRPPSSFPPLSPTTSTTQAPCAKSSLSTLARPVRGMLRRRSNEGEKGKNENARETRCAPRRERTLRLPLPFIRVAPLAFLGLFRLVLDLET